MDYNHCRICKLSNLDHIEPLVKYGVRHYSHWTCGLNRWGVEFLKKMPRMYLRDIPYRIVNQYQIPAELLVRRRSD